MSLEKLQLEVEISVSADRLYRAWLDSNEHTAFTGGEANITPVVGSKYTAWDGYIDGELLELEAGKRIYQTWRTTDFSRDAAYSFLELIITDTKNGCKLTLKHWDIPKGQRKSYEEGWKEHYFTPMLEYFESFGKFIG